MVLKQKISNEIRAFVCFEYILGKQQHNHNGQVGAEVAAKITSRVRKEAEVEYFKPVSAIVNAVLLEGLPDAPCRGLPKPAHLARNANHLRQKLRPTEPQDLEFELELDHVPDNFFRSDVRVSKMNTIKSSRIIQN